MNFLLSKSNILILILQIFLGFSIFSTSENIVEPSTNQMFSQEVQMFNMQFTIYEGTQSGSTVKQLITNVDTSNSSSSQQIQIYLDNSTNISTDNIVAYQKYNVYCHVGNNGYVDAINITTAE